VVRPALRSRSKRRVWRRVPGGEVKVFYERNYVYEAYCAVCGRPLGGVPRDIRVIRYGPKTAKRPERPYGGVLCSTCLATAIKLSIRS
jgi:large subunit ribosomal protein L34e